MKIDIENAWKAKSGMKYGVWDEMDEQIFLN